MGNVTQMESKLNSLCPSNLENERSRLDWAQFVESYNRRLLSCISGNMTFLKAYLSIKNLTIDLIKPDFNFLNKLWKDSFSNSSVVVEYVI